MLCHNIHNDSYSNRSKKASVEFAFKHVFCGYTCRKICNGLNRFHRVFGLEYVAGGLLNNWSCIADTFQSDTVCKPCPEGTYSDVEDYESVCKNHTRWESVLHTIISCSLWTFANSFFLTWYNRQTHDIKVSRLTEKHNTSHKFTKSPHTVYIWLFSSLNLNYLLWNYCWRIWSFWLT